MRDALEVLDLNLALPISGKNYSIKPPSAAVGAHLMEMFALGVVTGIAAERGIPVDDEIAEQILVGDSDLPNFGRQCLGAAYDEMVADEVPAPVLELAISTAFVAWCVGKEYAEAWWEAGGKAPAPRRAPEPPTATPTRSAAASTTATYPSGTRRRRKAKKR